MKCTNCNNRLEIFAKFCPECGGRLPFTDSSQKPGGRDLIPTPYKHNPILLFLVSLIIPGLGQVLLGQVLLGLLYFFLILVLAPLTIGSGYLVGGILSGIFVYRDAVKLNSGQPIKRFYWIGRG